MWKLFLKEVAKGDFPLKNKRYNGENPINKKRVKAPNKAFLRGSPSLFPSHLISLYIPWWYPSLPSAIFLGNLHWSLRRSPLSSPAQLVSPSPWLTLSLPSSLFKPLFLSPGDKYKQAPIWTTSGSTTDTCYRNKLRGRRLVSAQLHGGWFAAVAVCPTRIANP